MSFVSGLETGEIASSLPCLVELWMSVLEHGETVNGLSHLEARFKIVTHDDVQFLHDAIFAGTTGFEPATSGVLGPGALPTELCARVSSVIEDPRRINDG